MSAALLIHPVDTLTTAEKNRIYFCRVVDLAVVAGLLTPDRDSEIGHFAFSRHYDDGREADRRLQQALQVFKAEHPEAAFLRAAQKDAEFLGAVSAFEREPDSEKIQDLIRIGASYAIWPTGTSFVLTYPWDLEGNGHPVKFREDLSEFMRRRILGMLKKAGKLHNPDLFGSLESR